MSVEVIYEIITFKNVFCIIFLNLKIVCNKKPMAFKCLYTANCFGMGSNQGGLRGGTGIGENYC